MNDFLENKELEIFKNIFDSIPSRIAVIDKSCKLLFVNKAWLEFTKTAINSGLDACKSCAKTFTQGEFFFDQVPGRLESCSKVNDQLHNAVKKIMSKKNKTFEIEYSCFRSGQKRYYKTSLFPLERHTDKLIIKHEDITESKEKEKEIIDLNNFMQLVLDSLPHPFYVIDIKGLFNKNIK